MNITPPKIISDFCLTQMQNELKDHTFHQIFRPIVIWGNAKEILENTQTQKTRWESVHVLTPQPVSIAVLIFPEVKGISSLMSSM